MQLIKSLEPAAARRTYPRRSSCHIFIVSVCVGLFVFGCGTKTMPDAGTDQLHASCESFCARAVGCSEEFADAWKFDTVEGCADACVEVTHERIAENGPKCEEIMPEMWACAGTIDECEVFQSFEDEAYAMPSLFDNPCEPELFEHLANCT